MFIKTEDGKYVYSISLPDNDEIVKFVSIIKGIDSEIYLTGFDNDKEYCVNAHSILGVLYASVLDDLKCVSTINIMGEIARFIVEDNDKEQDESEGD